ncbi:hypothetical protein AT236_00401 [Lactobacillus delbrueckii subsp. bulgaricus]|nr:hypothetical protein AT236_00401 [Lactobacillus delbrueckii subsp. bulgaricus]EHE88500.1 hypothetical protein LDBUL1632_01309 [Lactobacillus delbrueckii subsp. bulgaricus CNCM I-1632]EHE90211.1 hypothetical protein LDBUL1519_00431 [Lactobacillus delbrueckii subsp. bulgaricus CNCM I-1519]OAL42320.1 hypothetical protein A0O29_0102 [Lactobacillus delbrueckii subsp. bulgaricus]
MLNQTLYFFPQLPLKVKENCTKTIFNPHKRKIILLLKQDI